MARAGTSLTAVGLGMSGSKYPAKTSSVRLTATSAAKERGGCAQPLWDLTLPEKGYS